MGILDITNPNFWISIYLIITNSIMLCFAGYKFLQVMQLGGYSTRAYLFWMKDTKAKWISRIAMLFLMTCVCVVVCNILFGRYDQYKLLSYIGLVFYYLFMIMFIVNIYKIPQKTPLKLTKRMWRLIIVYFLLMIIANALLLYLGYDYTYHFKYAGMTIAILLIPVNVALANVIIRPIENLIKSHYKNKSKRKLKKLTKLKVIGITGSYGKTSVKNFLKQILSTKYKVYASPSSFNTPMGLSKVILQELNEKHRIFIAEMGAIRRGDIEEICDFVKPDIAILTAIGNQHLKTFKTMENIKNTKYELIESLSEDGYAYFNNNSSDMNDLVNRCNLKNKNVIGLDNPELKFTCYDKVADENGLKFKLKLGDEVVDCQTKILGDHNIENILVAASVAYDLGVKSKDIVRAIARLEPASHRLEINKAENGVIILDDSFNANIIGTKMALKTLSYFEGRRKIIVTPGLVELGDLEAESNEQFGKDIAKVCDIVVVVNKNNKNAILSGLISQNFDENNVYLVDTLNDATKLFGTLLKRGDVVLIENDLPDNYS
ncbi:MAG: UDP-N-acetylmuramoyl-tripeptide--D-alanyl-D-alanine ligase [Clostridiales bacterium]|nr:UDP-N-acetylmuramoyl-tripeptide--D-alanyl-D-alanine ligase [Candidatus Apopatousia equi]